MKDSKVWLVISNTDLTEGRGFPRILYHCFSKTTATRLAKGKGVQGSDARVEEDTLFEIDKKWYGRVMPQYALDEDKKEDERQLRVNIAMRKALEAGLTVEEIKLLQS